MTLSLSLSVPTQWILVRCKTPVIAPPHCHCLWPICQVQRPIDNGPGMPLWLSVPTTISLTTHQPSSPKQYKNMPSSAVGYWIDYNIRSVFTGAYLLYRILILMSPQTTNIDVCSLIKWTHLWACEVKCILLYNSLSDIKWCIIAVQFVVVA